MICWEKGTLNALSNESQLWSGLLYFLKIEIKCKSTELSSAIRAAYNNTNERKKEHKEYLFILTDGLYDQYQRKKVFTKIEYCKLKSLLIILISIGLYPYRIENLFLLLFILEKPKKMVEGIGMFFS